MKIYKVSGKKILAGAGIVLLLGVSAGCSEAQKFSWDRLKETHYRLITGKHLNKANTMAAKEGQVVAANGTNAVPDAVSKDKAGETGKEVTNSKVNIVLYFADQNGDYLKAEHREIQMVPGLAKATVQELVKGPRQKGMARTIPQGTRVLDMNISNGLCTIDLSREFKDNHWGGSSGEILTVYSLVDTLTQFDTVEKVEILVEGQKIETLAGHMDLSSPVFKNTQIIKSNK